jgi:hypothetical protein
VLVKSVKSQTLERVTEWVVNFLTDSNLYTPVLAQAVIDIVIRALLSRFSLLFATLRQYHKKRLSATTHILATFWTFSTAMI